MIADEVQERLSGGEGPGHQQGVPVAPRLRLGDHVQPRGVPAGGSPVRDFIPRGGDEAHLLGPGRGRFFEDDFEGPFLDHVAVHEGLQRQPPLGAAGGGDDGFRQVHTATG